MKEKLWSHFFTSPYGIHSNKKNRFRRLLKATQTSIMLQEKRLQNNFHNFEESMKHKWSKEWMINLSCAFTLIYNKIRIILRFFLHDFNFLIHISFNYLGFLSSYLETKIYSSTKNFGENSPLFDNWHKLEKMPNVTFHGCFWDYNNLESYILTREPKSQQKYQGKNNC
jgi:hypothetical protein